MADRALVIGASGLVGRALSRVLEAKGWAVTGTAHSNGVKSLARLDVSDGDAVRDLVMIVRPKVVLLPAAYTNVEGCEEDPERCRRVNVDGARYVAQTTHAAGAQLVYYSSDYVFDGHSGPYSEADIPNPISVYGRSKMDAESEIIASGVDHLILRTTVVYGWERGSRNFAMQVWQRLSSGERMRVPGDQVGNPTLVDYLAEVTLRLIESDERGIVNVVGRDRMSRAEFGRRLARAFALDPNLIDEVPTSELAQKAPRPLAGGLRTDRLESILGTEAMNLQEALKRIRRQWRSDTYVGVGVSTSASSDAERLKAEILEKAREYYKLAHVRGEFVPFASRVPYAGRVYGDEELANVVDAGLDFWLTLGPWGDRFENMLKMRLGAKDVALVNSGSSANLTAVSTLMAPQLEDRMHPGDEVITPAATFPTTIAPLLQNRLIPVLVDCELGTYNMNPALVEDAISPRTRAIMLPHTLGNPTGLGKIVDLAARHNLFLIEDSCDALGSLYDGRPVGTFGDLSTISFYPAHHITMGEGGAVVSNKNRYNRIVRSVRDWGRDCWCAPGESNTCGKRFGWALGCLPPGYDHKYTYSNVGYNLKPTDLQAAIGVAQLQRLDDFVRIRRQNFDQLYRGLAPYQDRLILPIWDKRSEPAWFGFPITVHNGISRRRLVQWLEDSNIETRDLFGGHILKQPGYIGADVKVHGELIETERVLNDTFFVGVYPGLDSTMIDFVISRFEAFFRDS